MLTEFISYGNDGKVVLLGLCDVPIANGEAESEAEQSAAVSEGKVVSEAV